jgi:STE24 endopeptidase
MKKANMHPLIDAEKQITARQYRRDNRIVSLVSYCVSGAFICVLLFCGVSQAYMSWLTTAVFSRFLVILLYFLPLYLIYSIITLPFNYLSGYVIERKYEFSRQTTRQWLTDWSKSFLVSLILGVLVFEALYLITYISPHFWWLWLSLIMVVFTVVLSNLFPVLILPLFYKMTPMGNEQLKIKIENLCTKAGIRLKGVYNIDLSSKSTKANAAVVGLGNTKRILLGDTLVSGYSEEEIMPVIAHEMTHYQQHHMWWLILWQSIIILTLFFVIFCVHPVIYQWLGFTSIADIAGFPLFALIFSLLSFMTRPISAGISRYYERKADKGAIELTGNADGFVSVMAKFCNRDLAVAYPHPFIEWYTYSHPSVGRRIAFAENWKAENK